MALGSSLYRAPSTKEKLFTYNLGGFEPGRGIQLSLNIAKQQKGWWSSAGSVAENYPDSVDSRGHVTEIPSGESFVYLTYDWGDREDAVSLGYYAVQWTTTSPIGGANVTGSLGASIVADSYSVTDNGDGTSTEYIEFELTGLNWNLIFYSIPGADLSESLEIWPRDNKNWRRLMQRGKYWNPQYLQVMKRAGCYSARTMDLTNTNNNPYHTYAEYPGVDHAIHKDGVPLYHIAQLVKEIDCVYMQFQLPHFFDEDECAAMATALYGYWSELGLVGVVNLKIGRSNEVIWNTPEAFEGQRFWATNRTCVEFGELVGTVSRSTSSDEISVPDASIFAVNDLIAFDDEESFHKVTAVDTDTDTLTVSANHVTDGDGDLYRLDGFTANNQQKAHHWHTKDAYVSIKAFEDAWVAAGGSADHIRRVLEAQSANYSGVARQRILATTFSDEMPTLFAEMGAVETWFHELQIAPYIGGGFDNQTHTLAVANAGQSDTNFAAMRDLLLTDTSNGLPQQKDGIEDHVNHTTEFTNSTMIVTFYEGGAGMLQRGTATQDVIDFFEAFQKSSYFVPVLEQHLSDIIELGAGHGFPVFAPVSPFSQYGGYAPIGTPSDMDDPNNAWWQWMIGLGDTQEPWGVRAAT